LGRIGVATARIALGYGMKVIFTDSLIDERLPFYGSFFRWPIHFVNLTGISLENLLKTSDFIKSQCARPKIVLIGKKEF